MPDSFSDSAHSVLFTEKGSMQKYIILIFLATLAAHFFHFRKVFKGQLI
jgi:hypothetical protein